MISHFLIQVGYGYLMAFLLAKPFGSIYHARIFIPKYNHPHINVVQKGIELINDLGVQRFSHLDEPTKYRYYYFDTHM